MTHRDTDKQSDSETTDRQRQRISQTGRQQTDRNTYTRIDKQTNGQTDRQTNGPEGAFRESMPASLLHQSSEFQAASINPSSLIQEISLPSPQSVPPRHDYVTTDGAPN